MRNSVGMKPNGFSLVELMVALLLGSIITAAAVELFVVNRQTENLQQGVSLIQDQGRFIFDYVSRDLMQAGHGTTEAVDPFIFSGHNGIVGSDGNRYDVLVTQVDGGVGCQGNTGFSGIKQYFVNSSRSLLCSEYKNVAGSWTAGNSESLIDNVEAFQVLYGLDYNKFGEAGYGQANLYTNAAGAVAAGKRIVSVRFGVLLSSDHVVSLDKSLAPTSITLLDQTIDASDGVTLNDGRLFRVYSSTVALRNQMDPQ